MGGLRKLGQAKFRSVVPTQAEAHGRYKHGQSFLLAWIPAFAGMALRPARARLPSLQFAATTGLRLMAAIMLGLAFAALLAGGPAAAKETILTEDSVTRFLASFGEMRDIAIAEGLKTGMDSEAAKNPLGAVLKAIKSSKLKGEAEKSAKAHGFEDLKDWGTTGKAVAQSYLFITMGPARGIARDTLEKNKDSGIKQLEKLGLLNEASKKKLKEHLDTIEDELSREPPPANVAIVKKMKPDIDAAVKIGAE
jgi:hypothetical protein